MTSKDITYTGSTGQAFAGYLVTPDNPNGGAILVAHALDGLSDTEKEIARRYAELGYVVLAVDYIGDGRILVPEERFPFRDNNRADPTHLRASMLGAYAILKNHPAVSPDRIAAVGYCYGGLVAIELGKTGAELAAIVGLHTPLPTERPEQNSAITARVLVINAANDIWIPWAERIVFEQQMDAAGLDWEMVIFGCTQHGFTGKRPGEVRAAGAGYNERADARSWKLVTDMLAQTIGPK